MAYMVPMIRKERHGKLKTEEMPPPCLHCLHRYSLRWMLGVPFCEDSRYTCVRRTKRCNEFKGDYGTQLSLF